MAKKKKNKKIAKKTSKISSPKTGSQGKKWLPLLLGLLAFLLYANTLGHQYALDDASVITDNFVVKRGLAGWSDIFTTNYRFGFWYSTGTLYRPISLAVFAMVWQVSPDNPFVFHLINVLFYAATIVVLFRTLCLLWPKLHEYFIGAIVFIFLTHPVHVEVVANIKSLDEILSFFFILLAIQFYLKYLNQPKKGLLITALIFYTLSLFSKENAITFLAIFPMVGYYYGNVKNWEWIKSVGLFLMPAVFFLACRFLIIEAKPLDVSPLDNLLVATDGFVEWYATAFLLIGKYAWTLLVPIGLGSDFGYSQIPVTGFGNVKVILSLIVVLVLTVFGMLGFAKRNKWRGVSANLHGWIGFVVSTEGFLHTRSSR